MNPVALITGASRGIGRGIALELAGISYDLVINFARNAAAARQTASGCLARAKEAGHKIRAEISQADIALAARWMIEQIAQRSGVRENTADPSRGRQVAPGVRPGPATGALFQPKIITISSVSAYTASI